MASATFTIVVNLGAGVATDVSATAQELGKLAVRFCQNEINNKTTGSVTVPANATLTSAAVA